MIWTEFENEILSLFWPRSAEIFRILKMGRVRNFDFPLSQRQERREKLAKKGPTRRGRTKSAPHPSAKAKIQRRYLTSLGRGGRAERQAIQYASSKMPAKNTFVRKCEDSDIEPGRKFSTLLSGRDLKVFAVWKTNGPHSKTAAWVLYKRTRAQREADRRLGPYVAVPIELCRFQEK